MTAETLLALADALRLHALACGRDLNAANLFTHNMLTRALAAERARQTDNGDGAIDVDTLWAMLQNRNEAEAA